MEAYVFSKPGQIELRELPAPVLSSASEKDRRGAVLRPRYLSPCASDVHTVFAGPGPRRENLVLGHEGLAEVVSVGCEVKDFHPGELVAVSAVMPEVPGGTGHEGSPFSGGKLGRNLNGMWAEQFYVPEADENLAHIPEGITKKQALMCVDMAATGFTAAEEAKIEPGQTVAVLGLGAVGLMAVSAARYFGAGKIFAVGSEGRRECTALAAEYGADLILSRTTGRKLYAREAGQQDGRGQKAAGYGKDPAANSTGSPAVDRILDLTEGQGADRVLICGGDGTVLAQACDMVRYGTGIVSNVSYFEGNGMIGLPIFSLGRGMAGKTFCFSYCRGGRKRLELLMDLVRKGRLGDPGRLVTHRLSGFHKIPEALSLMRDKPEGLIKLMIEL